MLNSYKKDNKIFLHNISFLLSSTFLRLSKLFYVYLLFDCNEYFIYINSYEYLMNSLIHRFKSKRALSTTFDSFNEINYEFYYRK